MRPWFRKNVVPLRVDLIGYLEGMHGESHRVHSTSDGTECVAGQA